MLHFYYNAAPNPMKIALLLEELGLPFEAHPVDTRKGEQFAPAYLRINPNGKVPALVDGDTVVFDSNAILLYLADKTQQFTPPIADAAQREVWKLCGVDRAKLVAFTFPATPAVEAALGYVREENPTIAVMARTKFKSEADRLTEVGADIVVLDEQESGRAVVKRALGVLHLDQAGS